MQHKIKETRKLNKSPTFEPVQAIDVKETVVVDYEKID